VTAVEVSGEMVERGQKKAAGVGWIVGDMRTADIGKRYGLAVCAFNSFLCLLSVEDALSFLRNARGHLEPGGLLGVEVSVLSPEELVDPPGGPALRHDLARELPDGGTLDRFSLTRYDPAAQIMEMRLFYDLHDASGEPRINRAHDLARELPDGGTLDRFSLTRYDPAAQIMEMRLFYDLHDASGETRINRAHDLAIRLVGRAELELMLRLTGFGVEAVYGGFDGEPFMADSDHLVVLARK
jgi:SAM-dependent methyltransferase